MDVKRPVPLPSAAAGGGGGGFSHSPAPFGFEAYGTGAGGAGASAGAFLSLSASALATHGAAPDPAALQALCSAWEYAVNALHDVARFVGDGEGDTKPVGGRDSTSSGARVTRDARLHEAVARVRDGGFDALLFDWWFGRLEEYVCDTAVPRFWARLSAYPSVRDGGDAQATSDWVATAVHSAVQDLTDAVAQLRRVLLAVAAMAAPVAVAADAQQQQRMAAVLSQRFGRMVSAHTFAPRLAEASSSAAGARALPDWFAPLLSAYLDTAFSDFHRLKNDGAAPVAAAAEPASAAAADTDAAATGAGAGAGAVPALTVAVDAPTGEPAASSLDVGSGAPQPMLLGSRPASPAADAANATRTRRSLGALSPRSGTPAPADGAATNAGKRRGSFQAARSPLLVPASAGGDGDTHMRASRSPTPQPLLATPALAAAVAHRSVSVSPSPRPAAAAAAVAVAASTASPVSPIALATPATREAKYAAPPSSAAATAAGSTGATSPPPPQSPMPLISVSTPQPTAAMAAEADTPASRFTRTCGAMRELGWLRSTGAAGGVDDGVVVSVVERCLSGVVLRAVEQRVSALIQGKFDEPLLAQVRAWTQDTVCAWLALMFGCSAEVSASASGTAAVAPAVAAYRDWSARVELHAYESFAAARLREVFEIVRDFPDSRTAVADLRDCLLRTSGGAGGSSSGGGSGGQRSVVRALTAQLQRRLLIPGIHTQSIIDVYTKLIPCLRALDDTGLVLDAVSDPVRAYLRTRKDTVRCIMRSLTDGAGGAGAGGGADGSDEKERDGLHRELELAATEQVDSDAEAPDVEPDPAADPSAPPPQPKHWMPDPIGAERFGAAFGSGSGVGGANARGLDVLSTLVTIYGSRDVFVHEHRALLADRLWAKRADDYDVNTERSHLERLGLRFGENAMQFCAVMLKDMDESRRANRQIHANDRSGAVLLSARKAKAAADAKANGKAAGDVKGVDAKAPAGRRPLNDENAAPPAAADSPLAPRAAPAVGVGAGAAAAGDRQDRKHAGAGAAAAAAVLGSPARGVASPGAALASPAVGAAMAVDGKSPAAAAAAGASGAAATSAVTLDALDATIMSHEFWPKPSADAFTLPGPISGLMKSYAEQYKFAHPTRLLEFNASLGCVQLDVELADRTVSVECTPLQASIIAHFEGSTEAAPAVVALKDLSARLAISSSAVRQHINFWLLKGVLREGRHPTSNAVQYTLLERRAPNTADDAIYSADGGGGAGGGGDEDDGSAAGGGGAGGGGDLGARERYSRATAYVLGGITDFAWVAPAQVMALLQRVMPDAAAVSDAVVSDILADLVRDTKLECVDGRYRRIKNSA